MMKIKGKFTVISWDEKTAHELGGESKINRATVKQSYAGEVVGESTIEYTMYYPAATRSTFVGLEYFKGTIAGKAGQLVLEHRGKFENGVASSEFTAMGGTGELSNLQCTGQFATISHSEAEYEFNIS
jgi:hypothetical protein